MSATLTNRDYCDAAKTLGCHIAALMAVASVESAGDGYDEKGRIKVRFEGHKFREHTSGKYDKTHSELSYPYKLQKGKPHGYAAFNAAFALDEEAALKASSFGKFQPLAVNYREAGFANVRAFVGFLRVGEKNQLTVFCLMVQFRGLADELRREDFDGFARNYNGKSYQDFDYAGKMRRACARYKKLNINCRDLLLNAGEIDDLLNKFDDEPAVQVGNLPNIPADTPASDTPHSPMNSQPSSSDNLPSPPVPSNSSDAPSPSAAQDFSAMIPQMDTAKKYLNRAFSGSVLATIGAVLFGLPLWVQIALAALVIILVVGGIALFLRYYKEIFAFVTQMNTLRATRGMHNPILTTDEN